MMHFYTAHFAERSEKCSIDDAGVIKHDRLWETDEKSVAVQEETRRSLLMKALFTTDDRRNVPGERHTMIIA